MGDKNESWKRKSLQMHAAVSMTSLISKAEFTKYLYKKNSP